MILWYAAADYFAGDYMFSKQSGFKTFVVRAQTRTFRVGAR